MVKISSVDMGVPRFEGVKASEGEASHPAHYNFRIKYFRRFQPQD